MEGNPRKRLGTLRPRMCAVEAQRYVDCARGAYTRSDSQGAFRRQQACLAFLDQLRPWGQSTYLSTRRPRPWQIAHRIRLEDGSC